MVKPLTIKFEPSIQINDKDVITIKFEEVFSKKPTNISATLKEYVRTLEVKKITVKRYGTRTKEVIPFKQIKEAI